MRLGAGHIKLIQKRQIEHFVLSSIVVSAWLNHIRIKNLRFFVSDYRVTSYPEVIFSH